MIVDPVIFVFLGDNSSDIIRDGLERGRGWKQGDQSGGRYISLSKRGWGPQLGLLERKLERRE